MKQIFCPYFCLCTKLNGYELSAIWLFQKTIPSYSQVNLLLGNLTRYQNLLFPTVLLCFHIFNPRQKPTVFDITKKKKKIQKEQQIFIKLKSESEEWKTIQKASKRQWKMHTMNWEQLAHVLLRRKSSPNSVLLLLSNTL